MTGQTPQVKELPRSMLIVEDDDVFRRRLAQAFADRGFEVLFRIYGPEKPFFEKSWVLPDIVKAG